MQSHIPLSFFTSVQVFAREWRVKGENPVKCTFFNDAGRVRGTAAAKEEVVGTDVFCMTAFEAGFGRKSLFHEFHSVLMSRTCDAWKGETGEKERMEKKST